MARFNYLLSLFVLFAIQWGLFAQNENNPFEHYQPFKNDKNKWGYKVNKLTVINAQYEYVTHFSEGLALVKNNGKWGYIDTLGNWFIEARFDKGQPIMGKRAFVAQDGKMGLLEVEVTMSDEMKIDERGYEYYPEILSGWHFVLEPVYDNIREDYEDYYLEQNGKWGFTNSYFADHPIQCIYDTISPTVKDMVSGRKENGKWDLISPMGLVLEDMDEELGYGNYIYEIPGYRVKKGGKLGVVLNTGKWLIQPQYDNIETMEFPSYQAGGKVFNTIFGLLNYKSNNDDSEDTYSYQLAKLNGEIIPGGPFDKIKTYYYSYSQTQAPYAIEMLVKDDIVFIMNNFKVKKLAYESLRAMCNNSYFIGTKKGKDYILDKTMNPIDSFDMVQFYVQFQNEPTYNEFGEPNIMYDPETGEEIYGPYAVDITSEPFVLVYKKEGEVSKKAIYDLKLHKIISPWFAENDNLHVNRYYDFDYRQDLSAQAPTLYTYYTLNEAYSKMGFFNAGMESGTALLYEATDSIFYDLGFFVLNKYEGDKKLNYLFEVKDKKASLITTDYEITHSSQTLDGYYDEYGNFISNSYLNEDQVATFLPFTYFQLKKNGKYGVICNHRILEPKFDTIIEPRDGSDVLQLRKGDKIGYISIYEAKYFEMPAKYELSFSQTSYSLNKSIWYAFVYQDDATESSFLISSRGKKFVSTDNTFAKKTGKSFKIHTYRMEDGKEKVQNEAAFRNLYNSPLPNHYYAQGKNKKWGLINQIGDTLVPLKYSAIDFSAGNPFGEGNIDYIFNVTQKGKVGLYMANIGEIVKPQYDAIERLSSGYNYLSVDFVVSQKGKKGLIDQTGNVKIPLEYDEIYQVLGGDGEFISHYQCIKGTKTAIIPYQTADDPESIHVYDDILYYDGYVKSGDHYDVYNIQTGELLRQEKDITMTNEYAEYNIIKREGKFGAMSKDGKILIPCEYDSASFVYDKNEVMIGTQKGISYYINVFTGQRFTEQQW